MRPTATCLQPWFCLCLGILAGGGALLAGTLAVSAQMRGEYFLAFVNMLLFATDVVVVFAQARFINMFSGGSANEFL